MADPAEPPGGAGQRFVINVVGAVGLVFGAIPIARYVLGFDAFGFTVAPYSWLGLTGAARFIAPAMVLAVCLAVAFVLEKRLERRPPGA